MLRTSVNWLDFVMRMKRTPQPPSAGGPPVGGTLGDTEAEGAEEPEGEPVADVVPEREPRAVAVPVGGGEGGAGGGGATGRHAAEEAAPRYSVSSESQGRGEEEPLGQKKPYGQIRVALAAVPEEGQKSPAGQGEQMEAPLSLKLPAGHKEHAVLGAKVGHMSQYTLPLKSDSKNPPLVMHCECAFLGRQSSPPLIDA
jgi:hypothetical protein